MSEPLKHWRERGLTFPDIIDSSMRATFVECPESWHRRYLQGLTKRGSSVHLTFGGAFASGMEVYRKSYYGINSEVAGDLDQSLARGMSAAHSHWLAEGNVPDHPTKTLDRCLGALEAWTSNYPPNMDYVIPHFEGGEPSVEFSFALPIGINHPETGEPLLVSGRFDMLAHFGGRGGLYIYDDKTTSQLGQSWLNNFRIRAQFSCYAWGARSFGYDVKGAIIRGISILKKGYGFAEVIENRPEWLVANWERQMKRDINRMIECWRTQTFDQSLDTACTSYGGCPFLDLCSNENPEPWIDADFEVTNYNPLKSAGAEA